MGVAERRERERRRREEEIIAAATEVFASEGIDSASMDAIAARAELGKATLYYYFADKRAILDAAVAKGTEDFFREIASRPPPRDIGEAIGGLLAGFLDFFSKNRALLRMLAPYMALPAPLGESTPTHGARECLPEGHLPMDDGYLRAWIPLLEGTPWQDRPEMLFGFAADVIRALSALLLAAQDEQAEARVAFYVDLIRGRVARGDPQI